MTSPQRVAVAFAGAALALWAVVAIAVVATPREDGANIGAGLIALLAMALSILAAILLIIAANSTLSRVASAGSIGLWAAFLLLAPNDAAKYSLLIGVLAAGVAALTTSALLVARD